MACFKVNKMMQDMELWAVESKLWTDKGFRFFQRLRINVVFVHSVDWIPVGTEIFIKKENR